MKYVNSGNVFHLLQKIAQTGQISNFAEVLKTKHMTKCNKYF